MKASGGSVSMLSDFLCVDIVLPPLGNNKLTPNLTCVSFTSSFIPSVTSTACVYNYIHRLATQFVRGD